MDTDITDPSFKYAPSQNPMTPLGVYKPGALPNTMAQQVDFVPSGDNFADNIDRQTRQRIADQNNAMMLSMSKAAAGNAEEAAAAQRLGYETGVGADIAARNKQLLEQRLATDRLAQLDLFRRDPVLARMLANKDFAAVAHDDLPNLMESGEQINPDLSWFEEFKIGRARGYKGTERGITGMDMLLASAESGAIPESLRAKAAQQSQEMAALRASGGFLESFGALEGNIESTIPKQAEMAVYGAVAGGLALGAPTGGIGLIPGMIAGAGSGISSATITQSFQIEGGNLFIDMLDDGVPEDTARIAAPIGGAIIASLELLPLKFLSIEAKRLVKRKIAGEVLDTLKQTGMLDVFKRFLQSYGIGVSTEVGTELAQDAAGAYVQEMAMLATDPLYEEKWKSEKGRAELAKQFVETFLEVGQGMAIMGAFLPGANFISDARRASKAKATRQFFKNIDKNASESKLKGRNPRTYQEWYEMKARGTANHTLFIDIEKLREAMAKNNVSAQQLETILPGVTKAIADAKGMNGIDFSFPTSVYAARLSDLAFGQALQEHMRFDPKDMSIADEIQYSKEEKQLVEEMKESAMELMKADAAVEQSAQAVTDLVTAQLVAAGKYTESEARSMASVASASATVMSARFNMTPLDWHNKYGAKVFGEAAVAPAAPLEQASRIDLGLDKQVAFDEASQRPEIVAWAKEKFGDRTAPDGSIVWQNFTEWFGDSKTVDAEGKPVMVYHGTDKKFTKINMKKGAQGVFWVASDKAAIESGEVGAAGSGVIMELFASIKNPAGWNEYDKKSFAELIRDGYDGVILRDKDGSFNAIAFTPTQIKSAGENVGTFSQVSPSILEQAATVSATTYSALDRAVGEVTAKSLAAAGWKEQIKGWVNKGIVKQSEVEWSGLVEYLDMQEGKITKETVSEFLKNNGVKVETVTLGDRADMVKVAAIKGSYAAEAALGDIYGLGGTWQSQFETYRNLVRTDAPTNQIAEAAVPIDKLLENEFGTDLDEYIRDAYESGGSDAKYSRYVLPGAKNYREVLVKLPVGFMPPAPAISKEGLAARQVVFDKYEPQLQALEKEINALMYSRTLSEEDIAQRLADAGNEREGLETQRDAEANAVYRIPNTPKAKPFISSHWDESNVLVHLRMNDRTDADGNRVLFVEEVQSDYGQEGKKKGFVSPVTQEDIDNEEKLRNEIKEASRNVALARSAIAIEQSRILAKLGLTSYSDIISAGERRNELTDAYNELAANDQEFVIAKEKAASALAEEIRVSTKYSAAFEAITQTKRPFRAPFVETTDGWLNLGLKHVMLEAINGGYDRVAFVDGDQSVTRYKDALTEAVDEVEIDRNDDGTYNYKAIKDGKEVKAEESVTAERIEDLFGKSGGADLIEQADAFPDQINTIKSEDIKIGGEGMRKFYDDVLPAALNKLLKKYGGEKLQQIEIDTRVPEDNSYYETLTDDDIIRQRGFDVTNTMKERVGQGLPLFQAMPSGPPRATIDLRTFFITLNTAADLTSYLHEMAHFYMATYVNIANEPGAPPQITADLQIIFDWLGIKDLAAWNAMTMEEQRKYWEAFGYNHEIYLFEGKSPSVEMQGVFDRFSAWLRKIYGNIRDELNVIYRREFGEDLPMLTTEIRGVMDRMLATEKQIKYAESVNNMTPLFLTQEQSGYDDARWAAYQAMVQEAHDQSVTDLTKASLRQMEWLSNARTRLLKEMQAKHDDIRDKMRSDIAEEVAAEPVYMAMSVLKTGKGRVANGEMVVFSDKYKLNLAIVKKMIPSENLSKLGYGKFGMLSEDGLHPDMVAEMFGFKSGDELVLALLAAKPVKEEVDSRLDARMLAEYGDMNTPAEMEVQVQKALHNEARERFIGVEARFVASATRPVRAMTDAARLAANTIVNAQKIENIRPSNYAAAEARAARDAADAYKQRQSPEQARKTSYTRSYNEQIAAGVDEATAVAEATKKGDQAAAAAKDRQDAFAAKYGNREPAQVVIRAKQAQVVQNQLVKVSTAALEEVDTAVKDFRKFFGSDEKIAKSRNMDLVDAARAILSYYGFGKVDKNPADYIKKLEAYNPELYAEIEPLISQASTGVRDYTQMTMDDFRMLRDVVDALWAQSRRDKQITVAGKKIALDGVLSELDARLNEIGVPTTVPGEKSALTTKEKFAAHLYSAKALLRRVENWADATDGAGGVGAFTKYIYRPVKDAVNAYRVDRNNYVKRFVDLVSTLDLPVGKITSPELDYTFGVGNGGIGKAELLGAMLHTGNESNYKKLLIGRKWGEFNDDESVNTSRWDAFVGRMITEGVLTKEDFDFLQAVWDLNEEIKPIAQRAHRDLYGYYFKEVEATSFTNRFGTYRGGYVPAKTDAAIVRDAQRQAKAEELEADFRSSMPSTGMGFTKGRVEYNKPLSLDVRLMAKHIDDVLRFANIQPAIKDALRIVNNRAFADKLSSIDPTAVEFMLLPWLNRTARQSTNEPGRNKVIDNFWRTLRSRTGMSIMFANLRNALQQVTGLFPSALKVSKGALKDSLFAYLASPRKTAEAIAGLSPFMNERMHSQIFEIQDQMNDLLLNPSKFDKIQKWSQHHGYFLQSAFQNFVDIVTWNGKYNQVLSEIGTTLSDSEAQAEAIQQADAAVRSTQGSMSAEDVAAFEVGSPFYKTFVQFTGYFNMLANLNTDEYVKVLRDLGWRGNKGKLVSIYMLGFLAPTLVADAIARSLGAGWDDDDDGYLDDVADWFFGSQVRAGAAMVPFGSAAYTAFAAGFTARTYDDRITSSPSIGSLEASTVGVGKAVVNLASDDKELTGRNVRDVLTLITNATGVPVSVLGRPIGYQMEVNRGKVEPTDPIDYMRGLITGVPSAESKKK